MSRRGRAAQETTHAQTPHGEQPGDHVGAASTATSKLTYLKANELFRDFTPAQLEPFHHTIQMASCRAGHVFYRPGETGEVMFLVKEGSAQLYRMSPDGRKLVFAHVPQASMFGEMACIGQAMHDCFAEAVEDSLICTLSRDDVKRLILQYPSFALRLLEAVAGRWSKPSGSSRRWPSSRSCRAWRSCSGARRATAGSRACRTRILAIGSASIARP